MLRLMLRRPTLLAVLLALVSGCSQPTPATLAERGLLELRSGRYDEAIATCSEAIRANPDDAEAYLYRGRAYQFRNAMGDPQKAIADFGEAIRLAPHESDPYYSRALVYRDLGEHELADADERAARKVDSDLGSLNRQLPDPTQDVIAKARRNVAAEQPKPPDEEKASGAKLPLSVGEQEQLYEQLKKRFEPDIGTLGTEDSQEADSRDGLSHGLFDRGRSEGREEKSPRASLGGRTPGAVPSFGIPDAGLPGADPSGQGVPSGQNSVGNPTQPLSPFAPLSPYSTTAPRGTESSAAVPPSFGPRVRSPFPQRAPAPTGFRVAPSNPFAPPAGSAQPRTSQTPRQFGNPLAPNPYSNPAVRPANPRDYVP